MNSLNNQSPMEQTLAICFLNVHNYSVKDILTNHLSLKNKKKKDISSTKLQRWRQAIRLIDIDENTKQCNIIFSSIFYWCKYSRLIRGNKSNLEFKIHPKYFISIQHPTNIQFICSNINNSLIKLFDIPSSTISYSFICNDDIYISYKTQNDRELLIKIPSSKILNIKLLSINNNNNDIKESKNNNKCIDSELILSLKECAEIYEYYQRHKIWVCSHCSSVNKADSSAIHKTMHCKSCNIEIDANNPWHFYHINELFGNWNMGDPNLSGKKFVFVQQKQFYRKISSFDTNTKCNEKFKVLSPLFNVLNNKRDIDECIMFTNTIKLKYKMYGDCHIDEHFKKNMSKIDIELINEYPQCQLVDFKQFKESIDGTFQWLSDKQKDLIFPLLSRLLDFRNPAFCCNELDEFTQKIDELSEYNTTSWILKEAIMNSTNMNAASLEQTVESLEDNYQQKGVFDIEDENAKGPFVWDLQIAPFQIAIHEADMDLLSSKREWKELDSVSTQNYVVSFLIGIGGVYGIYDTFKNIRETMQRNSYLLISDQTNEIMHCLNTINNDNDYIQYGATICNNPLTDGKFIEYYKQKPIRNERGNDDEYDNDNNDGDGYDIDYHDVYHHEPPKKKMKINNNNNNNNNNNISIYSSASLLKIKSAKKEEIKNIIHSTKDTIEINIEHKEKEASLNKTIGRKRKRKQIIESSLSPISPKSPEMILPISYLKNSKNKSRRNNNNNDKEIKTNPNLTIINNIGYSFDVPIYNQYYYECADFKIGDNFDIDLFAKLCIDFACKSDLKFMRDLRQISGQNSIRRREIVKFDESPAQFVKGVPDLKYRILFSECFTRNDSEAMDIDLNEYLSDKKLRERNKRRLVIFERGFKIKESMKYRLMVLLKIYYKDIMYGVLDRTNRRPPWVETDESIINMLNDLNMNLKAIDLTAIDSDDNDEDDDVYMNNNNNNNNANNVYGEGGEVRIKQEFGFDAEYDSE